MSIAWGNVGNAEDHSPGPTQKNRQSPKSNLQASRLFWQSDPYNFVILQAGGERFHFPKSILVKNSQKLASMISSSTNEKNKPATIDFPGIDQIILGTYLHLTYCSETNVLNDDTEFMDNPNDLQLVIRLYQFTERFEDYKLADWLYDRIRFITPKLDDGDVLQGPSKLEWIKIYKDAFNALDQKYDEHCELAWIISGGFCRFISLHDMERDIRLIDDSPALVRALFLRLARENSHEPLPSFESEAASTDRETLAGSTWGVKAASAPAAKQTGDDWNVYQESSSADMWPAACYESVGTDKAAPGQASSSATVHSTNDDWGTGVATPSSSTSSEYNEFSWLPVRSAKKVSNDGWGPPSTENQDIPKKVSNGGWGTTATEDEDSTWKPASGATWGASGSGYAADSW